MICEAYTATVMQTISKLQETTFNCQLGNFIYQESIHSNILWDLVLDFSLPVIHGPWMSVYMFLILIWPIEGFLLCKSIGSQKQATNSRQHFV